MSQSTDAVVDIEHGSHYYSLEVTHEGLIERVDFLLGIVDKIANASQGALLKFMQENNIAPDAEKKKAIDHFIAFL